MPTIEEYDAWKQNQASSETKKTDFVLSNARKVNPDDFAADVKLGKAFGLSADLANAGRDMLQNRLDSLRNTSILKASPRTVQWLQDADNSRAAWDDLENLSWFESAGRAAKNTGVRAGERLGQAGNQYMLEQTAGRYQDRKMSIGEILRSEQDVVKDANGNDVTLMPTVGDLASTVARYVDARYADLIGTDDAEAARNYASSLVENMKATASAPKPLSAQEFEQNALKGDTLGEAASNIFNEAIRNPLGMMTWALTTAGESVPQMAAAMGVTAATRNPALGATAMGAGSYATERYTSPAEFLEEKGIKFASPEDVQQLLDNPVLLKEAADKGAIRGAIIGLFDMASVGIAGVSFSRSPFVEAIAQTVSQAVSGSAGEYTARAAAGQELNWGEILAEGLAEIATTPVDMGIAGRSMFKERVRAEKGGSAKATIDQLGDNASSSKLRQRLDGSFMDFVGRATEGTPIEDVFVPAAKLQELFQSYRYDPTEFLGELPGVDVADWETALSTGGDIKIPTATYAAKLAGGEFDAFLRENMRFDPEAMTFAEAQEFNSRATEIQMQAFEESEAARIAEEKVRAIDVQELDEMVGRLRAAGRSTDVARYEAMPLIAMRRTMAARSGMSQEEFAARYSLPEVRGEVPEGLKPKNVDELTRQLAEMRSYQPEPVNNGPSLLEAISDYGGINDVGGELKSRDAAVIKRGRGKKTLRLARGGVVSGVKDMFGGSAGKRHGVDDVAQAMIEAGYLQDNPVAVEYRAALENGTEVPDIGKALLDAINEELRGNVQYAGAPAVDERAASMERNLAYLDELGVSLNDNDDVIRAALEKAQAEEGRKYGQATLRQKLAKLRKSMSDLVAFSASSERGQHQSVEIAQVADAVADLVEEKAGVDIHGYRHVIDSSTVRHILKNHGNAESEAKRGMVAITEADLVDIPSLISSADSIVTGAKGKRGEDLVGYLKKLDDGTTLYIEEARRGKKMLAAVSMRKYPATSDYSSIAKTISPNVRNDGGNEVTITDVPANAKTLFQPGRRGSIQLPLGGAQDSAVIISLFEAADLSTFLHETGHYFLNTLQDMRTVAPDIQEMHDGVRAWWGENADAVAADAKLATGLDVTADHVTAVLVAGTTGDGNIDAAVDIGMHEQFARGFEAYLMEGKAPSIELRSAFERFTQWLVRLYKNLRGLNVQVSPEMRTVFDRLLATDEEIEAARSDMSDEMLFAAAEAAGLNAEDYRQLVKLHDQSVEAANEKLRREIMAPIKRETERWYREEKARVRDDVAGQVNRTPVYRALEWLGNRRWLGDEAPQGMPDMRLDRAELVARYGEGVLQTLPRGRFTIYANEGGMDVDEVAGWFGFDSGDGLVKALEQAQPRRDLIEAETDRVMRERHGDVLRDGQIEERAIEALHNDKRAQFLAAELKVLKARVRTHCS